MIIPLPEHMACSRSRRYMDRYAIAAMLDGSIIKLKMGSNCSAIESKWGCVVGVVEARREAC